MFAVSLFFFFSILLFTMSMSGGISQFIDPLSFIIVLPPAIIFTSAATSFKELKVAISLLFTSPQNFGLNDIQTSQRVFNILGNSSMMLGILTTLINWIAIGNNLNDIRALGSTISISILSFLYGVSIKLLCYVSQQKIQQDLKNIIKK